MKKIKFAIIGAGSVSFCPLTLTDILLSELFAQTDIEVYLMDISQKALDVSAAFCRELLRHMNRTITLNASVCLRPAVEGADFVVTAIEVNRYHYWSMDFHIPRQFGFRQVYGENGGPGGAFHFLRNIGPLLHIAQAMEELCPDAWLLNFTNPEAKLVEALSKLTKVKCVGLCHAINAAGKQAARFLDMDVEDLALETAGINHFGFITKLAHAKTGEDLYPLLREKERQADWLALWDEFALSRLLFRVFGLYPYPSSNHIGEYLGWSDEMLASQWIQYFYDPAEHDPWASGRTPEFVYSFYDNPTRRPLFSGEGTGSADPAYLRSFSLADRKLEKSREFAIPIAEAITFNQPAYIKAVNMPNKGYIANLPDGMVVEVPATADGAGIHPWQVGALPVGIAAMMHQQGCIHQLLIEAYREKSKNKLLQALLIDPTISTYNNAVALINTMCEKQKEILPELRW